jgi:hypothetical protein
MPRRMSCSMTVQPVRLKIKTVTRRHVDTWRTLQPGDRLTLIEKGMGLAKGAKQVVLAEVEIVSVRVETLGKVTAEDVAREGLWNRAIDEIRDRGHLETTGNITLWFKRFWADGHVTTAVANADLDAIECRRIEWRYLDEQAAS